MTKYYPVEGSYITDKEAQVYGERLAALAEKHGEVTAEIVVEDGASPDSPFHRPLYRRTTDEIIFEWRKIEARRIIRAIAIVVEDVAETTTPVRAFWTVSRGGYQPITEIKNDRLESQELLDREAAIIASAAARLRTMKEYLKPKDVKRVERAVAQFERGAELLRP